MAEIPITVREGVGCAHNINEGRTTKPSGEKGHYYVYVYMTREDG